MRDNAGAQAGKYPVSVLVLEAGAGIPMDDVGASTISKGYGANFGLTAKEIEQIARKVVLINMGNVNSIILSKTKKILKYVNILR